MNKPRQRQITIVEVAAQAGVSIATVSNVLTRKNVPLSAEIIKKVETAAELLNYRRNVVAVNLSSHKTRELGLMVPSFGGYYGRFAEEMQLASQQFGYYLSVFSSGGFNPITEKRHMVALQQRRVDGLFSHGLAMTYESTRQIVSVGTPLVLFNGWNWPSDVISGAVNLDFARACEESVYYFVEQGCNALFYVGRKKSLATDEQRCIGYAAGIKKFADTRLNEIVDMDDMLVSDLLDVLMDKTTGIIPIGILVFDENVAFELMSVGLEKGYRIPEQIKIVGLNNDFVARTCYPGITTWDIPYKDQEDQAKLAVSWMLRELGEKTHDPEVTTEIQNFSGNLNLKLPSEGSKELLIPLTFLPRSSTI